MQGCKVLLSSILTKEVIHPQPDSPFQVAQKSKTFNSPPFWQSQFCDKVCLEDEIIIIISLTYLLNLSMYIEFTILNHIIPNTNLWCPVCKFLAMSSWHTDCESLPRYHPDRVFLNYLPPPGSSRLKPGMIFSLNFPGSRTTDVIWTQVNYSNVFNRRFKQLWS